MKIDTLGFFYRAFSKEGIGIIIILLSIVEAISIKFFGISFFENVYTFVQNNEILLFTIFGFYIGFLCIFIIIYYFFSKKYKLKSYKIFETKEYKFLISPIILSGLFAAFFSFVFLMIVLKYFENFVSQKILGIYGKSIIGLLIGIVWLIIVRFFWKSILSEKSL